MVFSVETKETGAKANFIRQNNGIVAKFLINTFHEYAKLVIFEIFTNSYYLQIRDEPVKNYKKGSVSTLIKLKGVFRFSSRVG